MSSRPLSVVPPEPITAEVISFDGTPIHYDIYDAPSASTIVIVPGFWRDRKHASMQRLARFFNTDGYRVAVIDVRGHGDSGGTYGFNLHEHHDVAAVSHDLMARVGTTSSLTFVGFSYGGSIAISAAARHELPIGSMLLISAVADFEMIAPRVNPFTLHRHVAFFSQALRKPRFSWAMRKSSKIRALDDMRDVHVPLCFIHVKNDWLIGHRHSVELYEAANEPKELHLLDIEGNYHADRIFSVASDSIEPIVRDFLRRHC
ncbi:MAG TPA: alpha/beta fold hydrolase, partial [Thermoanaerobaculia bacterium]|nr:alpha/beta fold hydrolase [Thermoanaerobaculia bacterium]